MIKKYGFGIVLETNGRMFYYLDFFKKVDKYIDKYEIYLSFSDSGLCYDINGIKEGYNQSVDGVNNISKFCKNKKPVIAKVVVVGHNLPFLTFIIDKIK